MKCFSFLCDGSLYSSKHKYLISSESYFHSKHNNYFSFSIAGSQMTLFHYNSDEKTKSHQERASHCHVEFVGSCLTCMGFLQDSGDLPKLKRCAQEVHQCLHCSSLNECGARVALLRSMSWPGWVPAWSPELLSPVLAATQVTLNCNKLVGKELSYLCLLIFPNYRYEVTVILVFNIRSVWGPFLKFGDDFVTRNMP